MLEESEILKEKKMENLVDQFVLTHIHCVYYIFII